MKSFFHASLNAAARWLGAAAVAFVSLAAVADPADIGSVPPSTMGSNTVRPNLMFILDNSGSMASDFIPDEVGGDDGNLCFGYHGHNPVFYNPNQTYTLPAQAGGGSYPAASFTAAKSDGFTSSWTTDLSEPLNLPHTYTYTSSDSCQKYTSGCSSGSYDTSDGKEVTVSVSCSRHSSTCGRTTKVVQHFYYAVLNSGATDDCTDSHYTAVYDPSQLTAAQKQNYANWYQYYRTRMLMMRSASGLVFSNLDPTRYRVGFSTISYTGTSNGSSFLNVDDFDKDYGGGATQKSKFFTALYGQSPSGSTPLRPALMKAGQYFAKKVSNQSTDPMQYSCQRNYALLSTDGYWNTGSEPSNYLPKRLDGTAIGDVDGASSTNTPPPMYDAKHAKNALSDIAMYWYDTDLRTKDLGNCTGSKGVDVCTDRTPKPGDTSPVYQNMSTFTLGLGVTGELNYQIDYGTATTGDFADIVNGVKVWPDPLSSSYYGYANPSNTVTSRIDDLWHAAVNGRGYYYSAGDPASLISGLTDALQRIDAQAGASASAATSSLQPIAGKDTVFLPSYETKTWVGNVAAFRYVQDPNTGADVIDSTATWEAGTTLAKQSSRRIVMFDGGTSNKLKDFTYDNLSAAQKAYFDNLCASGSYKLNQCATLTTNARSQVTGANVVNYVRGNNQYEMWQPSADDQVFRARKNLKGAWTPLGDIIDSTPTFVGAPPFEYQDSGYGDFQHDNAGREAVLYVGANDGMLHAFRASDGHEEWAYVPTPVIPNLYHLADTSYSTSHRFYVDGAPVMGDIFDGSHWRTILVAGLGAGGKGYYALDITDPTNPIALWEFSTADMGLTFGKPVIGKNKAGQWVVAFTSGYNNTDGDGNGHLYVLNPVTGAQIADVPTFVSGSTAAGTSGSPSNLAPIQGWVDSPTDNTVQYIYGGDMLGNVWRFDFDARLGSDPHAFLLGTAKGPSGSPQPITVPPLLSMVNGNTTPAVTVATGRYLGMADLSDSSVQSIYTFKEDTSRTGSLGNFRADSKMVKQTMDSSHAIPSPATVDWTTQDGWYLDFDQSAGERVNVDMVLQLGMITVATTVPTPTPCSPGGTSWLYVLSVGSGTLSFSKEWNVLIVGVQDVLDHGPDGGDSGSPDGGGSPDEMSSLVVGSDGSLEKTPLVKLGDDNPDPNGGNVAYRVSWRELVN